MLSEKELREHFNMPLNEVAKKFGMCTTALKKLCRKYGVMQWPHRKLRSLEKKIASLRAEQRYTTDGAGNLDDEIRKYEAQREALISDNGTIDGLDEEWDNESPYQQGGSMDEFLGGGGDQGAYKQKHDKTVGSVQHPATGPNSWAERSSDGGGKAVSNALLEKQRHLKQLEEENTNLRELSRSLMKERQDLVNSLNSTSSEMEHLKNLCQNLTLQLTMASSGPELRGEMTVKQEEGGGVHAFRGHHNAAPGKAMGHSPAVGHMVSAPPAPPQWPGGAENVHRSPGINAMGADPSMSPGVWGVHDAPPPVPGGQHDDTMHSLSWMAPDFDLDELI